METKTFKSGSPIFRKPKIYEEDLIADDIVTLIGSVEVVPLAFVLAFISVMWSSPLTGHD